MNLKILYAIAALVVAGGGYFFGATTDGGHDLSVSINKAKAVYQCAETINTETTATVPDHPTLVEDAPAVKPVDTTAPAPSPTGESVGPTSMLAPPDPDPAPANVFAESRRTAICSSTRFLSGLDGGEGDGDPEPDKA